MSGYVEMTAQLGSARSASGSGAMTLAQALSLEPLSEASVVAGASGVGRDVRWADVVDIPDPLPWVGQGQLLLTTGISWPREDEQQRQLIRELARRNLAGVLLAVPHYLEHFPPAAKEQADREGLPLVEIPWEVPFNSVTKAVNSAIMLEQLRVIEQSAVIHRELTKAAVTAGSLQDLVDTLGSLIHRDITLEDPDGRLLAHWSATTEPDPVRQATLAKGRTPGPVLRHLQSAGHLDRVRNSPGPVRIPASPELDLASRVVCPIWLRGEFLGTVWIVEGRDELSELHLRAAEHAATVAALHIAGQREVAMVELRLGASFLDALLEGRVESGAYSHERARLLGFEIDAKYRVGVAALPARLPLSREDVLRRDRLAERVRQLLSARGGVAVTSSRLNRVIFLVPAAGGRASAFPSLSGCALALGREHPGTAGVRRSYREALSILDQVPAGEVRQYEEMLIERVLGGDLEARDAFLDQLFGPLRRARGGGVLLTTLVALADDGFHQRHTATRLHVHPNTLRYRLDRAADLLKADLTAPEWRFQLQLAARLMSLGHNPQE
ncbi:MAG: PucR family transcriptional regulator [Candidatus Dormibacteria bacterium]